MRFERGNGSRARYFLNEQSSCTNIMHYIYPMQNAIMRNNSHEYNNLIAKQLYFHEVLYTYNSKKIVTLLLFAYTRGRGANLRFASY